MASELEFFERVAPMFDRYRLEYISGHLENRLNICMTADEHVFLVERIIELQKGKRGPAQKAINERIVKLQKSGGVRHV